MTMGMHGLFRPKKQFQSECASLTKACIEPCRFDIRVAASQTNPSNGTHLGWNALGLEAWLDALCGEKDTRVFSFEKNLSTRFLTMTGTTSMIELREYLNWRLRQESWHISHDLTKLHLAADQIKYIYIDRFLRSILFHSNPHFISFFRHWSCSRSFLCLLWFPLAWVRKLLCTGARNMATVILKVCFTFACKPIQRLLSFLKWTEYHILNWTLASRAAKHLSVPPTIQRVARKSAKTSSSAKTWKRKSFWVLAFYQMKMY